MLTLLLLPLAFDRFFSLFLSLSLFIHNLCRLATCCDRRPNKQKQAQLCVLRCVGHSQVSIARPGAESNLTNSNRQNTSQTNFFVFFFFFVTLNFFLWSEHLCFLISRSKGEISFLFVENVFPTNERSEKQYY